jgi:hypothetical protein
MTESEFIIQLKSSKERGILNKEVISHLREVIKTEYKDIFPLERKNNVPEEAIKKSFDAIEHIWPEFDMTKILSPSSFLQTVIKSALNEYKRNS